MNKSKNNNSLDYFKLLKPENNKKKPIIVSSPHSGTYIPSKLSKNKSITSNDNMNIQDMFVNDLSYNFNKYGITVLQTIISRLVIDLNRNINEIDPNIIINLPSNVNFEISEKTRAGIGLILTKDINGKEIYPNGIEWREIKNRINLFYDPWHKILRNEIEEISKQFGCAFLIDLHSMPSEQVYGIKLPDFVIGNVFNTSSDKIVSEELKNLINKNGYSCSFNKPYSGGFITKNYSQLNKNVQCIQLEINKKLYMDEMNIKKNINFLEFSENMNKIIKEFSEFIVYRSNNSIAAE